MVLNTIQLNNTSTLSIDPFSDNFGGGLSILLDFKLLSYGTILFKNESFSLRIIDRNTLEFKIYDATLVWNTYTFTTGVDIPLNNKKNIVITWNNGTLNLYDKSTLLESKASVSTINVTTALITNNDLTYPSAIIIYRMIITHDELSLTEIINLNNYIWNTSIINNMEVWLDQTGVLTATQWILSEGTALTITLVDSDLIQDSLYDKPIKSFSFNGTSDYIFNDTVKNILDGEFTAITTFKFDTLPATEQYISTNGINKCIFKVNTSGNLVIEGYYSDLSTSTIYTSGVLTNQWTNVALIKKQNGNEVVYINGSSVVSNTETKAFADTGDLYIGSSGTDKFFKGYVLNQLIYNRQLTDYEIQYNQKYFNNPIKEGLILWYTAEAVGIDRVYDISGNDNLGEMNG